MSQRHNSHAGFTIIELMLAMTFIAILLLTIAMSTIYVSRIYTRGQLLQSVNQSGRTLSDMIKRDIDQSREFAVPASRDDAREPGRSTASYIVQGNTATDRFGGRLCLGSVSYVWNYASALQSNNRNRYNGERSGDQPLRFVRVEDRGQLCEDPNSNVDKSKATEYLAGSDGLDLALYSLTIYSDANLVDVASSQRLYAIDFVIGTSDNRMVDDSQNPLVEKECVPPDQSTEFNYCSVNRFNVLARAANR